ncbi:MAG TPA: radical SAM protein [Bacillota bacterium]|jgi:pyruvate-formate lyase-activating enzyme|nr:radical SAM protein [Bacillota bacterium]HOL10887.1 radical SAM protein [Bacillota bacterium]HPO96530.1 radical SAM protein [Bacillota bacterium]
MARNKVNLVYLDREGNFIEDHSLLAVGSNGLQIEIADESWIDLPAGADLMALPGRLPFGYDETAAEVVVVEEMTAVATILPMGYTRVLVPAYEVEHSQELPLFGYTAVGAVEGRLKVAALKTDVDLKWNPVYYNTTDLAKLIRRLKLKFPNNRILEQLAKCALEYHCLTAQNVFYGRWEAGIPVSPRCNADCLGCISLQPSECCPAPQSRINFVPAVTEVVELAVNHLELAIEAIVSFGQGCEGEPSLQRKLLVDSIKAVRTETVKGTINLNTNAGFTASIKEIVDAGLDSIRVSLFSAVPENYNWYHRPQGYNLTEVQQSLRYASEHGVMVALNLLFYPGFTNQRTETEALYELIATTGVKQVQLRNLNLDPEKLISKIKQEELPSINDWLASLKQNFPELLIGNYSLPQR